jgi:hypothetical protein
MSKHQPRRGVIYAATGEDYLETARRSARTLRKHAPSLPIQLFSDIDDTSGAFDTTVVMENAHVRSKVDAICDTPFEETLYLDCDTIVREDITPLFDLLERFDIALARVVLWHRDSHTQSHKVQVPGPFSEPNTGVILYRSQTPRMQDFLKTWRKDFYAYGSGNDQVTMRELLWTSDVRYYVLPEPFNKRVVEASELIYTDRPRPKIWHLPLLRPQKNPLKHWLSNKMR